MELLAGFAVVAAGTASVITAGIAGTASIISASIIAASTTIARTTAITSTGIVIVVLFAAVFAIFVLVLIFDLFAVPFESEVVGIEIFLSRKQIICQRLVNLDGLTSTISNSDDIGTIRSDLAIGAPNYVDFVTGLAGIDNPLGIGIEMAIDFKSQPQADESPPPDSPRNPQIPCKTGQFPSKHQTTASQPLSDSVNNTGGSSPEKVAYSKARPQS